MCDIEKTTNMEQQVLAKSLKLIKKTYNYELLKNPHIAIQPPVTTNSVSQTILTRGADFLYFHYGCDNFKDHGWGCAYRTLQSMCSWILYKKDRINDEFVPSLKEIQETLVRIGDKPSRFIGSRDWIGALEVFYVVDSLYDVSCKILHITKEDELRQIVLNDLKKYFLEIGGFVMMGGDVDAASKGIAGIHFNVDSDENPVGDVWLLIVDPHYSGNLKSFDELISKGYLRWQKTSDFIDSSFYNLCLPILK